jgi:hypothetical protein
MSEFDKLKDDAEQESKDHPQQVHEAEQDAEHATESKLGSSGQQKGNQQDDGGQQDRSDDDNEKDASQNEQSQ